MIAPGCGIGRGEAYLRVCVYVSIGVLRARPGDFERAGPGETARVAERGDKYLIDVVLAMARDG